MLSNNYATLPHYYEALMSTRPYSDTSRFTTTRSHFIDKVNDNGTREYNIAENMRKICSTVTTSANAPLSLTINGTSQLLNMPLHEQYPNIRRIIIEGRANTFSVKNWETLLKFDKVVELFFKCSNICVYGQSEVQACLEDELAIAKQLANQSSN